ncbi:FHA domain-containing protein [Leptolyngbyaceae cyanobacterium JSC-12]|nr:FHA domain-containing protein [Leptolyngbyaceae cyanobacterium JSC-12]
MLNLKPSGLIDQRTITFLKENPALSETLIAELGDNISQVSTIIEPILEAPKRCEASLYYIQAVATGRSAFLTTNLPDFHETHVSEVAANWLVGRSNNCAIAVLDRSVSRCHALIGHNPGKGFYIKDLGSSNGTFVNRSRLKPLDQHFLSDGDLLEFSKFRVEFFISGWNVKTISLQDTQG